MSEPKALVLRTAGTNCELETARALELSGAPTDTIHFDRVLERPERLDPYSILVFAGGFSPERLTRKILDEFSRNKGVLDKFCEDLAAEVTRHPKNPYLRFQLALALYKNGAKEEARMQALKGERLGLAGLRGHPHPLIFEVFEKSLKPPSKNDPSGPGR